MKIAKNLASSQNHPLALTTIDKDRIINDPKAHLKCEKDVHLSVKREEEDGGRKVRVKQSPSQTGKSVTHLFFNSNLDVQLHLKVSRTTSNAIDTSIALRYRG